MEEDALEILKQIDFFKEFGPEEMRTLLRSGEWVKASPGEPVITEGATDLFLYVLLRGQVNVVKNKKVLATLDSGDSFGEIGALAGEPRTAHVISRGDSFLLRFDPGRINRLPTELQLKFVKKLLFTLASRLIDLNRRFCTV